MGQQEVWDNRRYLQCTVFPSCHVDRFLMHKQCIKEVEVEEVYVEENFETPTMKHDNVRIFKFNEEWKDGITAKNLTKQADTNSSQALSRCT